MVCGWQCYNGLAFGGTSCAGGIINGGDFDDVGWNGPRIGAMFCCFLMVRDDSIGVPHDGAASLMEFGWTVTQPSLIVRHLRCFMWSLCLDVQRLRVQLLWCVCIAHV